MDPESLSSRWVETISKEYGISEEILKHFKELALQALQTDPSGTVDSSLTTLILEHYQVEEAIVKSMTAELSNLVLGKSSHEAQDEEECSLEREDSSSCGDENIPTIREVNQLSTLQTSSGNEQCTICSDLIHRGNITRKLIQCNHSFHQGCMDRWIERHSRCPECKTIVR